MATLRRSGAALGWICLVAIWMAPPARAAGVAMPVDGAAIRIEMGLKDKAETLWSGKIALSAGTVISVETGPRPYGKAEGATWRIKSNLVKGRGKAGRLVRPMVRALLDAPPSARVTVTTEQGTFEFTLGQVKPGTPLTALGGKARVLAAPLSARLTDPPTDDDFPAAAAGADGTVWAVYTAYTRHGPIDAKRVFAKNEWDSLVAKGHGDRLYLMKYDGKAWTRVAAVTDGGLDVWRPAVAADGEGRVWVVWSQFAKGNWDLYARAYDPGKSAWRPIRRLTKAPGTDLMPALATNPATGKVSVVWQGWRPAPGTPAGSFDILCAEIAPGGETAERILAATPANDWSPSVAFDAKGTMYVAYDTYEKGNYDVRLVSVSADKSTTIDVAATPRHEAHPCVAVDPAGRVWVAYEEAAAQWAKDTGLRWFGRTGEMMYVWREVRVRCVAGSEVRQAAGLVPAQKVLAGYPRGSVPPLRRLSLPRLTFDKAGRMWLLYRRHPGKVGSGERWASYATWHTPTGWAPPTAVPHSMNLLDNRPALVPFGTEGLLAVHSTDYRTGGTQSAKAGDVYATRLTATGPHALPKLIAPPAVKKKGAAVHPNEADDVKRIRAFRVTVGGKKLQILRGEFHRHTEITAHQDMDGTLEEMWRYGLDAAAMDWIGNGDHDSGYGNEYFWWLIQKQTDAFHNPPAFTPMFSYERSNSYPSGHRNALMPIRGIRCLPRMPGGKANIFGTPEKGAPDVQGFYRYLKHFGGICASHTVATGMGTDWRDNDPEVEPVVEIFQGCRQSYEHINAPATAKNAKDSIGGYRPAGFVWNALQKGYRLGFQSSTDHYSTHISYAMVYAEQPTREAIMAAFRKRHSYAANDNIILDVRGGTGQKLDHMMGDVFALAGKPALKIHAIGTERIARVSIIRGAGKDVPIYVYDGQPNKKEVELTWTDQNPVRGKVNYYYVRVEQTRPKAGKEAGALAWASPMWISVK